MSQNPRQEHPHLENAPKMLGPVGPGPQQAPPRSANGAANNTRTIAYMQALIKDLHGQLNRSQSQLMAHKQYIQQQTTTTSSKQKTCTGLLIGVIVLFVLAIGAMVTGFVLQKGKKVRG